MATTPKDAHMARINYTATARQPRKQSVQRLPEQDARAIFEWQPVRPRRRPRGPHNQYFYPEAVLPMYFLYLDSHYSRLAGIKRRFLVAIARRFNPKTGISFPSAELIAEEVGCCERAAQKVIATLYRNRRKWEKILTIESGLITGRSNRYRLRLLADKRNDFNIRAFKLAHFLYLNPDYQSLTMVQRSVVEAIARHTDRHTGIAMVSQAEICEETGFCERAVREAIKMLDEDEKDVIISESGQAFGRSNCYELRFYDPGNDRRKR